MVVVVNPNTQRANQNGQVDNLSDFGNTLRALIEQSARPAIPATPKLTGQVPAGPANGNANFRATPGQTPAGQYPQRDGGLLVVQPDGRQIVLSASGQIVRDTGPIMGGQAPQPQPPAPAMPAAQPVSVQTTMPVAPPANIRSNTIDRQAATPGNPTNPRGVPPDPMGMLRASFAAFGNPATPQSEKPFQLGQTGNQTPQNPAPSSPRPVAPSPITAMSASIRPVAGAASTGKRTAASVGSFLSRAAGALPIGGNTLSGMASVFAPSLAVAKAATLNPTPQPQAPAIEPQATPRLPVTVRKTPPKRAPAPVPGGVVVPGNLASTPGATPGGGPDSGAQSRGSAWGPSGSRPTGGGAGGERTGARSFYGR